MSDSDDTSFNKKALVKFLNHMLHVLPTPYSGQDSNRMTLIYFVVSGLDVLNALDDETLKRNIIEYVYNLQVLPNKDDPEINKANCGFRGGTFFGAPYNAECAPTCSHVHDLSHIAMTYTALAVLKICGDRNDGTDPKNTTQFSRVNKKAILESLRLLQLEDGSFKPAAGNCENDMRFIYCASVISYMLGDFSYINVDKAVSYIQSSIAYDYGIAQGPGQESHGGSTYCAVAALTLMNRLDALPNKDKLIQWCVERQVSGFQGRINKDADTCYSFWIGATLKMLGAFDLVDFQALRSHTLSCEQPTGGFSKVADVYPDVLHTYMSMCGLSFGGEPGIAQIDCRLGFRQELADQFPKLH